MSQLNCATTVPRGDLSKMLWFSHGSMRFRYPYRGLDSALYYNPEDQFIDAIDKRAKASSVPRKARSK